MLPSSPAFLTLRVERAEPVARGIQRFELRHPEGAPLPSFSAGAHIRVRTPSGALRQYSLSNDPAENDRYVIAVKREEQGRGGSVSLVDTVHAGQMLEVGTPENLFELDPRARSFVLIAGGIGITPILCMAERLANVSAEFEMHYCTRSRERTAFAERIERSSFAAQVGLHFDDGPQAQRFDITARLAQPVVGEHLYVCGPKGFMDAVLGTARQRSR